MSGSTVPSFDRVTLAVPGGAGVSSLAWRGDALVDVVAGNRVLHPLPRVG